jgi:hypothetical protein
MLSNGENISVIPAEKKLQIVAQNETHISIVMPCSSEVLDKSRNTFRIEGPYKLNCSESRVFNYIEQYRTSTNLLTVGSSIKILSILFRLEFSKFTHFFINCN